MRPSNTLPPATPGAVDSEAFEAVLQRFEAAWRQGPPPLIGDYRQGSTAQTPALLLELAQIDLEFRLRAGEAARVESYLSRYPQLAEDPRAVRDLVAAEFRLRRRGEPDVTALEYQQRFPQLGLDLSAELAGLIDSTLKGTPFVESGSAPERWPDDMPDYDILGELGTGGMGVVYKAVQRSLHRPVALKMIRAGAHSDPELLARFQREAEALARLQHPHIVQVYEVGRHAGCPYMAMEYVEGGSLRDRLAGRPQPPRAAAELVETLARAIHCAHACGIVHRDLKPANILLERGEGRGTRDEGNRHILSSPSPLVPRPSPLSSPSAHSSPSPLLPKIADFGLAKRFEEAEGQTVSGAIIGTPSYMAPEQAEGKSRGVGPLADVYALGAILYEMLTGRPPFVGETQIETIRKVLADEPVAPRLLQPSVPRDLATICLKCLEKTPARRYASAEALADDLRRYLAGEPILARRAGTLERAANWTRRHPAWAALVGVSTMAAAVLIVGGWLSYRQVSRQRDVAEENAQVAFDAVDRLYTRMAEERLLDEPNKDPLREELLARAPELYERIARQQSDDPQTRHAIARAWFLLGDVHRVLDQPDRAVPAFRAAIERQEAMCRDYPDRADCCRELAESHIWLGELLREDQHPAEAETHFRDALAQQRRAREMLRDGNPELRKCLHGLARSHYNLGIVAMDTGRPDAARSDYDRAIAILVNLHGATPDEPNCRQDLARALINRGILHKENDRPAEARQDYEAAREHLTALRRQIPARVAYKYEWAVAAQNLGNLLAATGAVAEALTIENDARVVLRELVADFSGRAHYKKKLASTLNSEGLALAGLGNRAGAEQSWSEARELLQALVKDGSASPDYAALYGMVMGNLGWLKTDAKDWAAARPMLEAAVTHLQLGTSAGARRKDYAGALRNNVQSLAETLVQLDDHAAAVHAAQTLADLDPRDPVGSYYASCFIARCIPVAARDARLDDNERHTVQRRYAEQAIQALRQTASRITDGMARLPNEKELLQPLEAHAGYTDAVAALTAKTQRRD